MGVQSPAAARFALDVKGLDGLKRAAARDPQAQLKKVATQFEALFLSHMLKSMRAAGVKSKLLDNNRTRFYQSMLDQQLAQKMAGKGLGAAQMLVHQLSARGDVSSDSASASGAVAHDGIDARLRAAAMSHGAVSRPLAGVPGAHASGAGDENATSASGRFVHRFAGVARKAASMSGVPALVILAQAALESGWGQHDASTRAGADSHNLFGIKAGSGWKGATAKALTHEYVDGSKVQARAPFRAYDSYQSSFLDHARMIGSSPRYAAVRAAKTPQQAARALQDCGYATDPHYADKLIAVMQKIVGLTE